MRWLKFVRYYTYHTHGARYACRLQRGHIEGQRGCRCHRRQSHRYTSRDGAINKGYDFTFF